MGLEQVSLCAQVGDKERRPMWVNAVGDQSLGLGTGGSQDTEVVGILSLHQGKPDCAARLTTILPDARYQSYKEICGLPLSG